MICLHPKKPHENQNLNSTSQKSIVEEQVVCRYCKYLLQGALLGDCRVSRLIGSGAFSDVYEAEQLPPLSRRVAIKVMSHERVADVQAAELFAREVGAISALDHPNILPVLRIGSLEDGRSYLVMKYASHGSLQNYCELTPQNLSILPTIRPANVSDSLGALRANSSATTVDMTDVDDAFIDTGENATESRHSEEETAKSVAVKVQKAENIAADAVRPETPLSHESAVLMPRQILPYVESAAAALQYAHDHGIIHLDVKPANLLLDAEDRLLLADFGASALLDGYTHASLHAYVGTPIYTAPEQWLELPRAASDQYALAVTCYLLLTGHAPFMGNLYSIMHGHLQTPPPPMREFNPTIPPQIESVIQRALAKEPAQRYEDMLAFARAYREALENAASAPMEDQCSNSSYQIADQSIVLAEILAPDPTASNITPDLSCFQQEQDIEAVEQKSAYQSVARSGFTPVKAEWEPPDSNLHSSKNRVRNLLLVLLVLLLLSGSIVGALRIANSCLLGFCPVMKLSTSEVDFVNNDSQAVKISNSGEADLHWSVSNQGGTSWLALAPSTGTLPPGKATTFTISTHAATMPNGTDTALVQVSAPGLNPQNILVKLTVQSGLSQIGVKVSGKIFSYNQGNLQPSFQTISITNKSVQNFSWSIQYSESNSWLIVTPNQGSVDTNASTTLQISVNSQNLIPHTYQTSISLIGKLDSQPEPALLSSFDFLLKVDQLVLTATPVVTPTTSHTFNFPNFSAQVANSTTAPSMLRSDHSMIWDSQDDLLFVFGGIDDQGNLLNDLWSYNPATQTWKELNASTDTAGSCHDSTVPAARMNAAMVWDSVDQKILLYGGLGANNHYLGDLWSYSPGAGTWSALSCSGSPAGLRSSNAVWTGSQMLLLGGANAFGLLSDFWSYTPSNGAGTWQKLTDSPMGQREFQTMVWDSTDNQLYVFGGLDVNGQQQNDFYVFSANVGWTQIVPQSTNNPPPRQQGMAVWDSKDKVMLLFGGWEDGQGIPYWGLWAFDPKQNAWGLLTPLNSSGAHILPGRTASAMVWDATDQHAYIYAGAANSKTGSTLNDLWMVTG
ncbi:MAG: Kelch repeat-containing protein [Ktedonobacteraceae bacterium]